LFAKVGKRGRAGFQTRERDETKMCTSKLARKKGGSSKAHFPKITALRQLWKIKLEEWKCQDQSQTETLFTDCLDDEWKVSVETAISPITLLAGSIWLGKLALHTDVSVQSVDIWVQPVTLDGLHNVDTIWQEALEGALRFVG
jgi:hypothetical protein